MRRDPARTPEPLDSFLVTRTCGLHLGPSRYALVLLDGSAKNHEIVAWEEGAIAPDGDDPLEGLPALLKRLAKDHDVPRESLGLAVDSGLAAFRKFSMPLTDRGKIEQVFKFEVESLLPQWSIDDVVVDFIVVDQDQTSSNLLAIAVLKSTLEPILQACEKGTLEPIEVELEATAMVNAAEASGRLQDDAMRMLVHVGECSTATVLVQGTQIKAIRAIHLGASGDKPADDETPAGESSSGEQEAEDNGLDDATAAAPPGTAGGLTAEDLAARIRREVGRSLLGLVASKPVEEILVAGTALPGLDSGEILEVPVAPLHALPEGTDVPEEVRGRLCAAYGIAARQLGAGSSRIALRREELRYSGTMERLEFPLAVAALLLVTLLGVFNIFTHNEAKFVTTGLGYWEDSSYNLMIGDRKKGLAGNLYRPSKRVEQYVRLVRGGGDEGSNPHEHLMKVRTMLRGEILEMQKRLGQGVEIQHPQSALTALSGVLGVLDQSMKATGARPSLRRIESNYQLGKRGKTDTVKVVLTLTFFAQDSLRATQQYEAFQAALRTQPWFEEFVDKPSTPLKGGGGIHLSGVQVVVDVSRMHKRDGA